MIGYTEYRLQFAVCSLQAAGCRLQVADYSSWAAGQVGAGRRGLAYGRQDGENMKKALVLEGGAMRGMYTAGVLDVFMDEGVTFDAVIGVSAGALFGVNYLSGQKGRAIRYNKRFNRDRDYLGLRPLIREGNIISTEYAYHRVPEKLDPFDNETYMASGKPFYAVVTDIEKGLAQYIPVEDVFRDMDVLRASGSMPFVSRPVELGGRLYLDGAVTDSIPFEHMLELGYEKLTIILTRPEDYVKKPMPPALCRLFYKRKYPAFADRLIRRHEMYNGQIKKLRELEAAGIAEVIRPSEPIEIGRIEKDPEKLEEVYQLGRRDSAAFIGASAGGRQE